MGDAELSAACGIDKGKNIYHMEGGVITGVQEFNKAKERLYTVGLEVQHRLKNMV